MENATDIISKRRAKMADLRTQGVSLFPNDFRVQHTVSDIMAQVKI